MMTFCDGAKPQVLDAIHADKIPYVGDFKFNNSSLFESNKDCQFTKMFWEMG